VRDQEITDFDDVVAVCNALGHELRLLVYRLLQDAGGEAFMNDLVKRVARVAREPPVYTVVKHHVQALASAGVVAYERRDGKFHVRLLRPDLRLVDGAEVRGLPVPDLAAREPEIRL